MGLGLSSFKYGIFMGYDEIPEKVIKLFEGAEKPEDFEYDMEIVKAALGGKIDLDTPFNLQGYNHTVRVQQGLQKRQDCYYLTENEQEAIDVPSAIYTGHVVRSRLDEVHLKTVYETIEDDVQLEQVLNSIRNFNREIMVYERVDLIGSLKDAVRGVRSAIATVRMLCEKYEEVADAVKDLLSSGRSVEELLSEV